MSNSLDGGTIRLVAPDDDGTETDYTVGVTVTDATGNSKISTVLV